MLRARVRRAALCAPRGGCARGLRCTPARFQSEQPPPPPPPAAEGSAPRPEQRVGEKDTAAAGEKPKRGLFARLRAAWNEYGIASLIVYASVWFSGWMLCFVALESGLVTVIGILIGIDRLEQWLGLEWNIAGITHYLLCANGALGEDGQHPVWWLNLVVAFLVNEQFDFIRGPLVLSTLPWTAPWAKRAVVDPVRRLLGRKQG
eukprot:TRINITY_DN7390_c0_g1_i1.p2 TRINITY_DN7390_c0_g1~~TRINITY_DN7390_c0_g1_i1.p2  ORF type:complete len:225 (+),score=68.86 TRINITY_DN7390_c0_g1_i1:66-677(+)